MALIYRITNLINNKIYIGKTTRTLEARWTEHHKCYKSYIKKNGTTIPLYNAIHKYGFNNFKIEIIEDNISNEEINNKEKYYIKYFNAQIKYDNYNVTEGGDGGRTWNKLSEKEVEEIKNFLCDEENLASFTALGEIYGVHETTIHGINSGIYWRKENTKYPLRKYDVTGLTITKSEYKNIINEIQDITIPLKDLQSKYNLSEEQVTSINQGYYCYNGKHNYYKEIYSGPFPIRKNKNIPIKCDFVELLYEIIFTTKSFAKIGEKFNIPGNTIQYIALGRRRKEITNDYKVPLRQHIEENKKFFMSLHKDFKEVM